MKLFLRGCLSLVLLMSCANIVADCNTGCATDCNTDCNSNCNTNCNTGCCDNVGCTTSCNYAKTFYRQYPQGQHMGQNSVGVIDKMHLYGKSEFYGLFDVNFIYEQTFRANKVSSYFAGQNGLLCVGPNVAENPAPADAVNVRNSDLGLAADFEGCACFKPKIQNFIANFDLYMAWDEFICGLWTRLLVPVTWTKFQLNCNSTTAVPGAATYPAGFVAPIADDALPVVYTDECAALRGNLPFGDAPVLNYGKVCCNNNGIGGVAGIQLDLGYNFYLTERSRIGIAFDVIFPSGRYGNNVGNNCCAPCLFNNNIGAQKQWQVGGILGARHELWNCDEQALLVYFEGMFNAILPKTVNRLAGLRSGSAIPGATTAADASSCYPFNHYLLLKQYNAAGTYVGLQRAANLLCEPIRLQTMANIDLMAALQYTNCGFDMWLGYHFAYVSREKGCLNCCTFGDATQFYVIKGTTAVDTGTAPQELFCKTDSSINQTGTVLPVNADNLAACTFTCDDVCIDRALAPSLMLNGLFGYVGYDWAERCDWAPFLGVGFNVDFGRCNYPLSQWGVFLKAGVQF